MKKLLIPALAISVISCKSNLTINQKIEKKKMAKEKCIVITAMAIHAVGFKILADNQTVIK